MTDRSEVTKNNESETDSLSREANSQCGMIAAPMALKKSIPNAADNERDTIATEEVV